MPVNLTAPLPSDLHPVPGVKLGITQAGVRKANRRDLTVITLDEGSAVAGVFTKNRFCAAPVQLCQERLAAGSEIRALVINTGNANAGTVKMAWCAPAPPASPWRACCTSRPSRSCRFRPA